MGNELVRVMVNGKWYEIEIGEVLAEPFEVLVNGTPYIVQMEMPGEASNIPEYDAPHPTMHSLPAESSQQVNSQASAISGSGTSREIHSPMPGVIVEIHVKAGEEVKSGQVLCFLEAMKMKNAIRSPREGKISAIEVMEGQKVAYNDLLVRFE